MAPEIGGRVLPGNPGVAGQLHNVGLAHGGVAPRLPQMLVHARAHVEGGDFQLPGVSQPQTEKRIRQRETLDGLLRVKVIAGNLVRKVQAGTDDRRSVHAARSQQSAPPQCFQ